MRIRHWLSAFAVLAALMTFAPQHASAIGWDRSHRDTVVYHRVYQPRYRHVYVEHDPYGYHSARVPYYPYYNSRYWRPRSAYSYGRKHRHPVILPDYYSSWGYPLRRQLRKKRYRQQRQRRVYK